jgi:glycerol-3-phosphate cytidylyltransferase-like family protein
MKENDRRSHTFRFETLLELLDHYSDFLTAQQMEAVIRDSARIFVERDFVNEQQTRLEFIKKCEYIMEALVSMKEATVHHGIED